MQRRSPFDAPRYLPVLVAVIVSLAAMGVARAQTTSLTADFANTYPDGGNLTFTATVVYPTPESVPTAIGLAVQLPPGWVYVSMAGPSAATQPTGGANFLEWAFSSFPAEQLKFTFTVSYPAGLSDSQTVTVPQAYYRSELVNMTVPPITFTPGPTIATQPVGQTVNAGQTVALSVVASASPVPISYQWQKGGVNIGGATNATLPFSPVASTDSGTYAVVVTSGGGSVTSSSALLTVYYTPVITTQPPSTATANLGQSATFTVAASGLPAPTYAWRKNSVNITGNTSAATTALTLANIQATDAGTYDVVVANSVGSVTSSAVVLTVLVPAAIATQPSSAGVTAGQSAAFTVVATGVPAPGYQWRKGGSAIAGATNATLNFAGAQPADEGTYDVVVSNGFGNVPSNAVTLTVNVPPAITTQPAGATVIAGGAYTFNVVASGKPTPIYQWRKGGVAIANATNASLVLATVAESDQGSYDVLISNVAGSVQSNAASLLVNVSPTIASPPNGQMVAVGGNATFTVAASGTAPLSFQWSKDGSAIAGATGSSLALTNVAVASGGTYTVKVDNVTGIPASASAALTVVAGTITVLPATPKLGDNVALSVAVGGPATGVSFQWSKGGLPLDVASAANLTLANIQASASGTYTLKAILGETTLTTTALTLTVAVPPAITTPPAAAVVTQGQAAAFSVVATGTPAPGYQWKKGSSDISGATNATLSFASAQASDEGDYSVVVTNLAGTVTSNTVTLTVNVPPAITTQPVGGAVTSGGAFTFTVVATGKPAPTYQWRKGGSNIANATNATLAFATVASADAGTYDVIVGNVAGDIASSVATLVVNLSPTITTQLASQMVAVGGNATLSVVAGGTTPLSYQWSKDGTSVAGVTGASLALTNAALANGGTYTVRVDNITGNFATSTAALTVVAGTITASPAAPKVGDNVTLSVAVGGPTSGVNFEWRKNGASLDVASATTLTLSEIQTSGAGSYTVAATFGSTTLTTAPLVLAVLELPVITTNPSSAAVGVGGSVTLTVVATGSVPLSYQWRKGGAVIAGATTTALALTSLQVADAGSYTVDVSNGAGSVTSTAAALAVIDAQPTHAVAAAGYVAGGTVTIANTLTYTGTTTGLGWQVLLPSGWSYASGGGSEGDVKPRVGTTELLEWAWTTVPASPVTFTYTLNVPAGTTGTAQLAGLVIVRQGGLPAQIMVKPDPLLIGRIAYHDADTDRNFRLSLFELTRLIELYNYRNGTARTGEYRTLVGSEDGFMPGPGTITNYHSADTNRDGRFSLAELTRVIELYNYAAGAVRTGEYHSDLGTEDGFAPGPWAAVLK